MVLHSREMVYSHTEPQVEVCVMPVLRPTQGPRRGIREGQKSEKVSGPEFGIREFIFFNHGPQQEISDSISL